MKFNFENTKDSARKIVMGAGIITASANNLEGQEAKLNNSDEKIYKTEIVDSNHIYNPEIYRSEYLEYMKHPSYKERLAKEMFGDIVITDENQINVENEYNRRLSQIQTIPIYMIPSMNEQQDSSHYSLVKNTITTTPLAAPHELTHSANKPDKFMIKEKGFIDILNKLVDKEKQYFSFINSQETKDYYQNNLLFSTIIKNYVLDNKDNISLTIPKDYLSENENPYDFILSQLNELNIKDFNLEKYYKYISSNDRENIEKNKQFEELKNKNSAYLIKLNNMHENYFYYYRSDEIKARLDHLRMRAIREFGFNLNDEFDINKLNELKNDKQFKEIKEHLNLSDEQINELMKYTAMNEKEDNINGTDYHHPEWDYKDPKNNKV